MNRRERLLRSPGYWFQDAQLELYSQVNSYMKKENINRSELAERLDVSKGYISQILNGNFNYTLKKLIDISLRIGKIPRIIYKSIDEEIKEDKRLKTFLSASYQTEFVPVITHSCVDNTSGKFNAMTYNFQLRSSNLKTKDIA